MFFRTTGEHELAEVNAPPVRARRGARVKARTWGAAKLPGSAYFPDCLVAGEKKKRVRPSSQDASQPSIELGEKKKTSTLGHAHCAPRGSDDWARRSETAPPHLVERPRFAPKKVDSQVF